MVSLAEKQQQMRKRIETKTLAGKQAAMRQRIEKRQSPHSREMSWEEYRKLKKDAYACYYRCPLPSEPCVICGQTKSYAHHPDYRKPFLITWLCGKHHYAIHKDKIGWLWLGADSHPRLPQDNLPR